MRVIVCLSGLVLDREFYRRRPDVKVWYWKDLISANRPAEMDFDDLTRKLGQFGRYQRQIYAMIGAFCIPAAFNNMGIVFIAGVPDHWCDVPALDGLNLTQEVSKNVSLPLTERDGHDVYSSCSRYARNYSAWGPPEVTSALAGAGSNETEKCSDGWVYDTSTYTSTIVTQFDLVCEDKWLQATSASVYMAGLMAGVFIVGSIADIAGRKPAFVATMLGALALSISVSFAPNFIAFCVLRFLAGFCTISLYTTGFVIGMEIIGPDYRVHCGIAYQYFWSVGYLLYAMIAYFIRDWSTLNLVASCCLLPILVCIFTLPESPRWLYLHGRTEKAEAIVRQAAKVNKIDLPEKLEVVVERSPRGYFWDLCKTPRMGIRSANIFFNWFVNSCVYYGLSLNTSNLGGNDYVNFALSGAVEVPSYVLTMVAVHYVGRRWPLCGSMVIGGLALLCILAVPKDLVWLTVTLAMLGKFCISGSFAIIYVFSAELYPTVVRNIGVGSGSFFARVGGVTAPYIAQLSDISSIIPMIVFGSLSLAAGLLALALPETKDQKLPETLEDGENFGRKNNKEKDYDGEFNPVYDVEPESTKL